MQSSPLLILDTHPIQYRAPIFQHMQKLRPDTFQVVYASDFSARPYRDREFGAEITWSIPLLEGYPYRVLRKGPLPEAPGFRKFSGSGLRELISDTRPGAIFLNGLGYEFFAVAYREALLRRIPIWYRSDTNDVAFTRSKLKTAVRAATYRAIYAGMSRFFYVGELNRRHYLAHGVPERKLSPGLHCTPDHTRSLSLAEKQARRLNMRASLGIASDATVVAFFGKLIPKKDPSIILQALRTASADLRKRAALLYVGTGELEQSLRQDAANLEKATGIRTLFPGFINQGEIGSYYLAADIVVLPSQRMGETWGLVSNEALEAGCAVVISEAVGCSADFGGLDRVRVFPPGNASDLHQHLEALSYLERNFDWARTTMAKYSIESAAESFSRIDHLSALP